MTGVFDGRPNSRHPQELHWQDEGRIAMYTRYIRLLFCQALR